MAIGDGAERGQLRVRRGRNDAGMVREIIVEVDGKEAARLAQGTEMVLDVAVGDHVLQARMDWTTSEPLNILIRPSEEAIVEVALPFNSTWRAFTAPKSALKATLIK